MNKENINFAIQLGKKYNRPVTLYNEDSKSMYSLSESTRTIFDDEKEMMISFRSNRDFSDQAHPFTVSCMEYDSVKLVEIDVNAQELMEYLEELGESVDDYKDFIKVLAGTCSPTNYNKKYETKIDENGNEIKVEVHSNIPSVQQTFF